jgi:hypothetical protein
MEEYSNNTHQEAEVVGEEVVQLEKHSSRARKEFEESASNEFF